MSSDHPVLNRRQITDIDERALQLVAITHGDGDTNDVDRLTRNLSRTELIGLAISCAALADPDRTADELLAWLPDPGITEGWTDEELRAAHAAHRKGDRTPRVRTGHQIYKRVRMQRARSIERQTA